MKRYDRPLVILVSGVTVTAVATTNVLTRYVRPTMRPWLLLAGAALLAAGCAALWREWRRDRGHPPPRSTGAGDASGKAGPTEPATTGATSALDPDAQNQGEHRHVSRVAWLLLLPVVTIVLADPAALGASSVDRQQSSLRRPRVGSFDLDRHLASHSSGGRVPDLTMTQFYAATMGSDSATVLARTTVQITGFAVERTPDGFLLARLQLGCCAGDAVPIVVRVHSREPAPEPDQWVSVDGRYDPGASEAERLRAVTAGQPVFPVFSADSIQPVEQPDEPYEYPW